MIALLLSTYNGERYLREQLDSLFRQTHNNWVLFIRDDGSTDETVNIVNSYMQAHNNIVFLSKDTVNMGASKSFIWLLENVEADYYMFCDQDDVWLPDKIEITIHHLKNLEEKHPRRPALVFTDLSLVDNKLNILHRSMWDFIALRNIMEQRFLCCMTYVTGCTIAINNIAKHIVLQYKHIDLMHDALISLVVSKYGVMHPIQEPLILYRQHENNVIGAMNRRLPFIYRLFNLETSFVCRLRDMWQTINDNIAYYTITSQILNITLIKYLMMKILIATKRNKRNETQHCINRQYSRFRLLTY